MDFKQISLRDGNERDELLVERRISLARAYNELPRYTSPAFWFAVESPSLPLEVVVRVLREADSNEEYVIRNRLLEIIIRRTQTMNAHWATSVLKNTVMPGEERSALIADLCADLYESMIRALLDTTRLFWEENFLHCLRFERKHVYTSFMRCEGRWHDPEVKRTSRIPRVLVTSLDQPLPKANGEMVVPDIEDEQAQKMLFALEPSDLLSLVLYLPERLKTVIVLLFWEGLSEKETARIVGVSDRTIRNRIQAALKILRGILEEKGEYLYERRV